MTTAILLQTLVSLTAFQFVAAPMPNEGGDQLKKPTEAVLSASITSSTPTPTPIPITITYTAQTGDTIRRIAREHYGSERFWVQIFNDNPELKDPAVIHPGNELVIRTTPPETEEEPNRPLPSPTPTVTPTQIPTPTEMIAKNQESPEETEQIGSPTGTFAKAYEEAGNKYGIPWQILSAIHQVETGRRDGPINSGAGPQGPMQFMPGTWEVYGVDGDGDGNADINNAVDAIHGAAHYLSKYETIEQGLDSYGKIREDVLNIAASLGYKG